MISDIIERIVLKFDPPFRPEQPKLIETGAQVGVLSLMKQCWEEDPEERPDIANVVKKLKIINKGK